MCGGQIENNSTQKAQASPQTTQSNSDAFRAVTQWWCRERTNSCPIYVCPLHCTNHRCTFLAALSTPDRCHVRVTASALLAGTSLLQSQTQLSWTQEWSQRLSTLRSTERCLYQLIRLLWRRSSRCVSEWRLRSLPRLGSSLFLQQAVLL